MKMQLPTKTHDFSKFLGDGHKTRKLTLIDECIARGISIYRDDATESSSGVYSMFGAVASQTELEKRMIAQMSFNQLRRAFRVQVFTTALVFLSLLVAISAFVKPFLMP